MYLILCISVKLIYTQNKHILFYVSWKYLNKKITSEFNIIFLSFTPHCYIFLSFSFFIMISWAYIIEGPIHDFPAWFSIQPGKPSSQDICTAESCSNLIPEISLSYKGTYCKTFM